jgi:hypothetical protein
MKEHDADDTEARLRELEAAHRRCAWPDVTPHVPWLIAELRKARAEVAAAHSQGRTEAIREVVAWMGDDARMREGYVVRAKDGDDTNGCVPRSIVQTIRRVTQRREMDTGRKQVFGREDDDQWGLTFI